MYIRIYIYLRSKHKQLFILSTTCKRGKSSTISRWIWGFTDFALCTVKGSPRPWRPESLLIRLSTCGHRGRCKLTLHWDLFIYIYLWAKHGKNWRTDETWMEKRSLIDGEVQKIGGKHGFLMHVTACDPGVWLTTTTLSAGVVSTLHWAEGTLLPSEFHWVECRLLAGPEHTRSFYSLIC